MAAQRGNTISLALPASCILHLAYYTFRFPFSVCCLLCTVGPLGHWAHLPPWKADWVKLQTYTQTHRQTHISVGFSSLELKLLRGKGCECVRLQQHSTDGPTAHCTVVERKGRKGNNLPALPTRLMPTKKQ